MNPISILIVDDSLETLEVLEMCLTGMGGHEVTCVPAGRQAIELLQQRSFDVILTDMLMPEVDGVQVIMAARRFAPGTQVVAMTGGGEFFAPKDLLRMANTLGADAQLSKPFNQQQLLTTIEAVCGRRGAALAGAA